MQLINLYERFLIGDLRLHTYYRLTVASLSLLSRLRETSVSTDLHAAVEDRIIHLVCDLALTNPSRTGLASRRPNSLVLSLQPVKILRE